MKVRPLRLLSQVGDGGFSVGWLSRADEFGLVRSSTVPDLFEQLIVKATGKRRDAVFADAAVSVVRGPMATKGLIQSALLFEIADVPERGWSIVTSESDALKWERRLAAIADGRLRELAETRGPDLLAQTACARDAVRGYVARLPRMGEISQLERWLSERCTPEQRGEALRLAEWPGVMRMRGGDGLYRAVTLSIVHFGAQVEGAAAPGFRADPLESPELMWRIQILADVLMAAYGLDAEALKAAALA